MTRISRPTLLSMLKGEVHSLSPPSLQNFDVEPNTPSPPSGVRALHPETCSGKEIGLDLFLLQSMSLCCPSFPPPPPFVLNAKCVVDVIRGAHTIIPHSVVHARVVYFYSGAPCVHAKQNQKYETLNNTNNAA